MHVEVDVGVLPCTCFQPGQLNQVWHNLIQNALDAVGDAGVVTVRARAVADRIEFTVADTGPGVPQEHQARLFEPFFTTKGVGKGTGLGLSIAKKIVDLHGGEIQIRNLPAGGVGVAVALKVQ